MFHGGEPLHRAGVGETEGPDRTVRPRLARGPLDGVVPIPALLLVGLEHATGTVAASDVLQQYRVAPAHRLGHQRVRRSFDPTIRGSVDQNRESSVAGRTVEIGPERDAVAHGDSDPGVDPDG